MNRKLAGLSVAVVIAIGVWPSGIAAAGTCPVPLPQGSDPVTLDPERTPTCRCEVVTDTEADEMEEHLRGLGYLE